MTAAVIGIVIIALLAAFLVEHVTRPDSGDDGYDGPYGSR